MGTVSRVGVGLDLMEQALDVGDAGVRVAADTWFRWMTLAGRLALVSAGQGVAAFRGLDATGPLKDAFKDYIGDLADLPGKAGKAFELEWEAARNRPREVEFETLLVSDVPHWRSWNRLASRMAQVSTAWQKKRGRRDAGYGERLLRVAKMPLTTASKLAQKSAALRTIMKPRSSDPVEALVSVSASRDGSGTEDTVQVLIEHVIDRLEYMAWRPATPGHEITNALEEYKKLLGEATDAAVATGREYDRHADRYGMAWGFSHSWSREQLTADERLIELADAHRQRLAGDGSRITAGEVGRFLKSCEDELGELAAWPVEAADESNKAFRRMIQHERKRIQQEKRRRARR